MAASRAVRGDTPRLRDKEESSQESYRSMEMMTGPGTLQNWCRSPSLCIAGSPSAGATSGRGKPERLRSAPPARASCLPSSFVRDAHALASGGAAFRGRPRRAIGPTTPAGRGLGLAGQRRARRGASSLALHHAPDGTAALRRRRSWLAPSPPFLVGTRGRGARAPRGLPLGARLERHAGAASLGEADGDRLLGRPRPVLALADVMHLFPNKLAGGRGGTLPLTQIFLCSLQRLLLGHRYLLDLVRGARGSRWKTCRSSPLARSSTRFCEALRPLPARLM